MKLENQMKIIKTKSMDEVFLKKDMRTNEIKNETDEIKKLEKKN